MMEQAATVDAMIARLADIVERRGAEAYLGEPVTMAEHMLQTATLAQSAGASDALVAAALLHDIGHFTGAFGFYRADDTNDRRHDEAGARVLEATFPPLVVACVRQHVAAKRYLCGTDAAYGAALSLASQHSLTLQGGPMDHDEIAAFECEPFHADAVRVRRWDDRAKVPNMPTPSFAAFRPLLERVLKVA